MVGYVLDSLGLDEYVGMCFGMIFGVCWGGDGEGYGWGLLK